MRVVDVCAFYSTAGGGVKTYVERKVRAAAALGVEMTILAPARPGDRFSAAGGVVSVPGRRFPLDGRYRYFHDEAALHAVLDDLQPDFVEASSPWASAGMVARWRGPAPRALVMHADPLASYAYRWLGGLLSRDTIDQRLGRYWEHLRQLDSQFDLVVCAGASLAKRLTDGGLQRIVTIPMGVEPGVFSPALRDETLRARLLAECGLAPSATLLLGVGRLAPEKRWPMVIDAAMAAGIDRPIALVLVGDGRDRGAVVARAGGDPHIRLLAPMTERLPLARLIASADVLVHGCESETFCMVASEARASGLPLIVPDLGGAYDQLEPGGGRSYLAGDAASLAQAIRAVVDAGVAHQRERATRLAATVRTMDTHFAELFAAYSHFTGARARLQSTGSD